MKAVTLGGQWDSVPRGVSAGADVPPQGTLDNGWRHFCLLHPGECYWHQVGGAQGHCSLPYNAKNYPNPKCQ